MTPAQRPAFRKIEPTKSLEVLIGKTFGMVFYGGGQDIAGFDAKHRNRIR